MQKYDSMYKYVSEADISHFVKTAPKGEEIFAFSFKPIDDDMFIIGEKKGKYIEVNWGENGKSLLLKTALNDEVWGIYKWDNFMDEYHALNSIHETEAEALNAITEEI